MKYYRVYGLNLIANIALPGPIAIEAPASGLPVVNAVLGQLPSWLKVAPPDAGMPPNWYPAARDLDKSLAKTVSPLRVWQIADPTDRQEEYFYCRYDDETTFVVDRLGTQIWATWPDDLTLEDTATYLLGPILGFILRLRGTVCLHASAIAIADRVVVLVGAAGAGKSTTAAAFAQRGYPILSDDVVPLIDCGETFLVQSAYPRIRLWDNSVTALYGDVNALPRLVPTHPTWDKRYVDLNAPGYEFQSEPLPLAAIYYLNERGSDPALPQIEPMTIPDRLITLVTNTYTNYLLDKSLRSQEFKILSHLVSQIPMSAITPDLNIAKLPELLDLILADMALPLP
ncbi:hypothetical protein [Chamaesiphon polymorphus]|uniref:Serine/threonine protein kinase n=1 Tax=Chamaesiphon polymorphus CCALA 037 TaxID=2107692 RepID=A0A2T1GD92_9CYAN|nr:hypothetical protein [Chamaesiphon polymorphus]PSB55399.1 hypothetical protein C7B77_15160 [Chamaesiphon polymorphus CCALA 037]